MFYATDRWVSVAACRLCQRPGPTTRIFVPPFDDPVNPNIAPVVVRAVNLLGDAITRRLDREGKRHAVYWRPLTNRTAYAICDELGIPRPEKK